jgi:hypothetical protein
MRTDGRTGGRAGGWPTLAVFAKVGNTEDSTAPWLRAFAFWELDSAFFNRPSLFS